MFMMWPMIIFYLYFYHFAEKLGKMNQYEEDKVIMISEWPVIEQEAQLPGIKTTNHSDAQQIFWNMLR